MISKIKNKTHFYLTRIGQYMGLDILYFVKGGFWLGLGHLFSILMGLIVIVALARMLPKQVYGEYQFILSVLGIVAIFSLPGINTAVIQSTAKGKTSLLKATKSKFKWSFLGSLALIFVAGYFYYIQPGNLWKYFLIIALFFPFLYSFDTYGSFLIGRERFKENSIFTAVLYLVYAFFILSALFIFNSLFAVIIAYCVAFSMVRIFLFLATRKEANIGKEDKCVLEYGKKLTLITLIPNIAAFLDKIIIPYFLGLENLAIYAIALIIPETVKGIARNTTPLFFSRVVNLKSKELLKKIKQNLFFIVILLVVIFTIGWFLVSPTILLIFGEKYASSIFYSQILLVSLILTPFSQVFNTFLKAQKKSKELFYYNLLSSSTQIICFLIFIPLFGIWGAVLSKIILRVIVFVLLYYYVAIS